MPRTPDAPVRAAGGVLWRPGPDGDPEVVVVRRPRDGDWSLPEGRLDDGEHPLQAAVREVREETGHTVVAQRRPGTSAYEVVLGGRARPKTVQWWALRRSGEQGPGDDADRPLSGRGRTQAARLAALLPLHAVRALRSAPPLRCRQTLAPLADVLGLPVVVDELLGDAGRAARPLDAAALVRALAPGTVACSQGAALPALLPALGAQQGPVRKGAARVLWRDGDRLVADDLLDPEERPAPGRRD